MGDDTVKTASTQPLPKLQLSRDMKSFEFQNPRRNLNKQKIKIGWEPWEQKKKIVYATRRSQNLLFSQSKMSKTKIKNIQSASNYCVCNIRSANF